jgi:glycosyltransferase involved in cell wall biosynthesis
MKILLVADTLMPGGAEWFLLRKCRELQKRNHEVVLFVSRPDMVDRRLLNQFPEVKFSHLPTLLITLLVFFDKVLNKIFRRPFLFNSAAIWSLKRIIRAFRPDVIHSHLLVADCLTTRANMKMRIRHVITIHGDYIAHLKTGDEKYLNRISRILNQVTAIVVISEEQRDILYNKYPFITNKLFKIYNGFYLPKTVSTFGNSLFTFGMIARGIPEKGWEIAIEAFRRLKEPNARLILYGESKYLSALKARTNDRNICFRGFTDKPLEAIVEFDVGLFPSYYASESLPTTIIEYLSLNKPVITADVGECAVMITDSDAVAGKVVPLKDGKPDIELLSGYMKELMDDKQQLGAMSQTAARCKIKFDMGFSIDKYLFLYNS